MSKDKIRITQSISLRDVEKEDSSSVWVLNKTNPAGVINLSMPDGLGRNTVMVIPRSFVPIDLSTQAIKDDIVKSPDFRKLVSSGLLWLVAEDVALTVISTPEGRNESLRMYQQIDSPSAGGTIETPTISDLGTPDNVSGFAINIVNTENLEEGNMLTMIRGQEGVLTDSDYSYIMANSIFASIKEYCAEELSALKA